MEQYHREIEELEEVEENVRMATESLSLALNVQAGKLEKAIASSLHSRSAKREFKRKLNKIRNRLRTLEDRYEDEDQRG